MSLAKCKGCDVEIRWARVDGRWCAFEADPSKDGTHVLVPDDIKVNEYNALWSDPKKPRRGPRYLKHNETCPARSKFQKRGPA